MATSNPNPNPKERVGACLKAVGNWSKIQPEHKFDHEKFSREIVLRDMEYAAPKLKALLDNITRIDAEDMRRENRVYKHFIYSDIKSSYGAKLIASGLAAYGFQHAYKIGKGTRGMSFQIDPAVTSGRDDYRGNAFAVLTSVSFFEKNVGVQFRKELLQMYNSRPDNVYGDKIRIVVLDSGFREGVDLFDVRYAHLFEPIATVADEKQAVGRVTRYCGQKGLEFHPMEGWPVQVYRYETEIPKQIKRVLYAQLPMLEPASNFFELFMKFSNIDPKKINFANELADVSIRASVDSVLTENIHSFKIPSPVVQGGSIASPGRKHTNFQERIVAKYGKYKWPPVRIENGCTGTQKPLTPSASASTTSASASASGSTASTAYTSTKSATSWYESPGGAPQVLPFTPTQDFIRHYFTPSFKHSGMLLWHSVGTGKTCSAIATASSSFEKEDYSIIYVTRHTLKGDVWKNMFDQVCSVILQERLKKGLELPELQAQRMRLLEKRWLEPMSYRQFSNALDGRSQLATDLIKRNGREDPLRKTLVIIDEAHKLFAPDVAGSEKPDIDVIRRAFDTSREVSGKDGVKLLFMTATPYTSQPMDLIKLLNLLRPVSEKFPEAFEDFSQLYLDENGRFTEEGKLNYWDAITGYISYLNREKDIRTFSYAKFHEVRVPMTNYEFDFLIQDVRNERLHYEHAKSTLGYARSSLKDEKTKVDKIYNDEVKELESTYGTRHEDCTDILKVDRKVLENKEKELLDKDIASCRKRDKECLDELKKNYITSKNALKESAQLAIEACTSILGGAGRKKKTDTDTDTDAAPTKGVKKAKTKTKTRGKTDEPIASECIETIKKQLNVDLVRLENAYRFDKEMCMKQASEGSKECIQKARAAYTERVDKLPTVDVSSCDSILDELKEKMVVADRKRHHLHRIMIEPKEKALEFDEDRVNEMKASMELMESHLESMVMTDRSQRLRVEKCLEIKPAYKRTLKNDPAIVDVVLESGPVVDERIDTAIDNNEIKKNMFLVLGHGSEKPESVSARLKMPKDKVLVIFPVCSRPNYMNLACKFIEEYKKKENHKLFADPLKNKDRIMHLIQQPMHIFLPGEHVPNLSTDLFLAFNKKKSFVVGKSGVYRITNIPEIHRDRLPESKDNLGSSKCSPLIGQIQSEGHYNKAVHHEMYKGNLFKPVQPKKGYTEMTQGHYSLQTIMNDVGTGVYYYIGCRSATQVPLDLYERILLKSEEQQNAEGRSKRLTDLEKILLYRDKDVPSPSPIKTPSVEVYKSSDEKKDANKPSGGTILRQMKALMKDVDTYEKTMVAKHFSQGSVDANTDADGDMDAKIVKFSKHLEQLNATAIDEPSEEEKVRMRRKAFLQGNKLDLVTREDIQRTYTVVHKALEFLAYIRMHLDTYVSGFVTAKHGKNYIKIVRNVTYTYSDVEAAETDVKAKAKAKAKEKKTFLVETVGYIPSDERNVALKCSSQTLTNNLLKLLSEGVYPAIPRSVKDWEASGTKKQLFETLCSDVKQLMETIQ